MITPSNHRHFSAQDVRQILGRHQPKTAELAEGLRSAAVLAPFYLNPDGLSLIFTKRTEHLDQHSGQISFPGGRRDPEDANRLGTALRETHEEIGVRPEDVEVWGRLNQEATITKFSVSPFVGAIPYPYDFKLNHHEVERLIIVPLDHLLDPANFQVEDFPWEGRIYKTYRYPYQGDVIWGATARMVYNLLTLLRTGREPEPEGI
jgi:8-oxo-dGTP pyrophosphatase MutT (NUDIX family)